MKKFRNIFNLIIAICLICLIFSSISPQGNALAATPVITGKDGWYFIDSDSTIPDYEGTNLFTQDELDILLARFLYMRDSLAMRGIEFVVFLAPNKEHIYSEYMPDSYGEVAPYTRIQQVYDYLKDYIRIIYPEEELLEAKEKYPYDIYYRTDPHWNNIGNYLMSKLLMEELGTEMPELEELVITPYEIDDLDCSKMLGKKLPDTAYYIAGYEGMDPGEYRMLLAGDSFGYGMSLALDPVVSDIFMIHHDLYEPYMLDTYQPTVLVYEVLERFLDTILLFNASD